MEKIFYTDNYKGYLYVSIFSKIIEFLGMSMYCYLNLDSKNIKNSSLDNELRNDFYKSSISICVFGEGSKWTNITNNWVIHEMTHINNKLSFIYVNPKLFSSEKIPSKIKRISLISEISNEKDFEKKLEKDLTSKILISNK